MSDAVDVAIVGAGPYGLSVAAHLRGAGRELPAVRPADAPVAGRHAAGHVPQVAGLRVQPLRPGAQPHPGGVLRARPAAPTPATGCPVPLDTFISYGQWFADELAPGLEEILVTDLVRTRGGFELSLSDGTRARARNVVLAAGVEHFARVPQLLSGLGPDLCTHTSQHTDLSGVRGPAGRRRRRRPVRAGERGPAARERRGRAPGGPRAPRWPGTASPSTRPARSCSGWPSRSRAWARARAPGSTPGTRSCSGCCPSGPGSTGRGPRWARPAAGGCATGSRASSPC